MNWDEELEAVQAKMEEREKLWQDALAAGAMGSVFAEAWFDSLTPEQQAILREMIEEVHRKILAFLDNFRTALVEVGRVIGERLMPDAFGITAGELRRRECDANRPRLYWDGGNVVKVGRYRPYRSRRVGR